MTATVRVLRPTHPAQPAPDGHVGAVELCYRAGLSYRQGDFWTATGLLQPACSDPGSGTPRWYPLAEVHVAALTRELIEAGFALRPAVALARRILAGEPVTLAGGLVRIDPAAAVQP